MNKHVQLSLIYIYKSNDYYLENLLNEIQVKTNIELIILSNLSKSKFPYQNLLGINISFHTFPLVSTGFLYNQGINLASANIIEIINNCQTALEDYLVNRHLLQKKHQACIAYAHKLAKINFKQQLFFIKKYAWQSYLQLSVDNYFLNKELLVANGLFFHEHGDKLAIIDLIIRAQHYELIIAQSKNSINKQNLVNVNYFQLGKDLFWLFSKYNKSKHFLLSYLWHLDIKDKPFGYLTLLGIIDAFLKKRIFIKVRQFVTKLAVKWNKLSRRLRLNKCVLFPIELAIEPTNYCNSHCPLCPTGSNQLKRSKGYMTFDLFKKIIDESKFFLNRITLWNLGEPFLNQEIYSMIQYAKRYGIKVVSSTNGYAFYTKSAINKLIESNIDSIIVAADGADKETFSKYRKGVKYHETIVGLQYMRDEKRKLHLKQPTVEFQLILMKQTSEQIKQVKQLAKNLNACFVVKYLNIEMVNSTNKQKFLPKNSQYHVYKQNGEHFSLQRKMQNTACVAWDGMVINWDGSVNPCIFDYYSDIVLGNVKSNKILSLWHNEKFNQLRQNVLKNKQNVSICKHCPINSDYSELYYRDP